MVDEFQKIDKDIEELKRIKSAFDQFTKDVEAAQKGYKEIIDNIIQKIQDRKIREVRKKIKTLL